MYRIALQMYRFGENAGVPGKYVWKHSRNGETADGVETAGVS